MVANIRFPMCLNTCLWICHSFFFTFSEQSSLKHTLTFPKPRQVEKRFISQIRPKGALPISSLKKVVEGSCWVRNAELTLQQCYIYRHYRSPLKQLKRLYRTIVRVKFLKNVKLHYLFLSSCHFGLFLFYLPAFIKTF